MTPKHCGKDMVWQPSAHQWYCTKCHSTKPKLITAQQTGAVVFGQRDATIKPPTDKS